MLQSPIACLKSQPDFFNGPFGFLLIINFDDATHAMSVCSAQAATLAMNDLVSRKISEGTKKMHIGEVCTQVETLPYTISETATNFYSDVLLTNHQAMQKAVGAVQKCAEILKSQSEPKRP